MNQGERCGFGRGLLGAFAVFLAVGCAGKSERHGDGDGDRGGRGGGGGTDEGGTSSKGGKSGKGGQGGTAGTDAPGGTAGTGGASLAVTEFTPRTLDKIDLLFMVDNSISMGDKQRIL